MDIEKIYNDLINTIPNSQILKNEPMSKYTSFKIGGNTDILVKAYSENDIEKVIEIAKKEQIPLHIIGNGSNILVRDAGIRGIVLMVGIDKIEISKDVEKVEVKVGAGTKLSQLAHKLAKEKITGLEFASRNTWYTWRSNKNECRCTW